MRLLNTITLELEEFTCESSRLKYAILSHRWEEGEVSYKDWRKKRVTSGKGYDKILRFCRLAKRHGYDWVWIDTCCIDKRSSAELSEAINSMWRWYEDAKLCYVYLSDVPGPLPPSRSADDVFTDLEKSAWFTRGWTLQEFLAPARLLFCSAEWQVLCPRDEWMSETKAQKGGSSSSQIPIWNCLPTITGIPSHVIQYTPNVFMENIAERMSWASKRRTTRPEDMAYCLIGLFRVNMPLLYGEGSQKAFVRLQLEIIRASKDMSIFAWTEVDGVRGRGLLAPSPRMFAHSSGLDFTTKAEPEHRVPSSSRIFTRRRAPRDQRPPEDSKPMQQRPSDFVHFAITQAGIELDARSWRVAKDGDLYHIIPLGYQQPPSSDGRVQPQCLIALSRGENNGERPPFRNVHRSFARDLGQTIVNVFGSHDWEEVDDASFIVQQIGL